MSNLIQHNGAEYLSVSDAFTQVHFYTPLITMMYTPLWYMGHKKLPATMNLGSEEFAMYVFNYRAVAAYSSATTYLLMSILFRCGFESSNVTFPSICL